MVGPDNGIPKRVTVRRIRLMIAMIAFNSKAGKATEGGWFWHRGWLVN